jgi:hypothetical protein
VIGHAAVDVPSQFYEAGLEIPLFRLPRQIIRIDWDAVSAQAGAGVEGLKAKWLGRGGLDDFPNIQSHAQCQELQLIDQGDVYAAVNVFQQLSHLGDCRRRHWDDAVENCSV